MSTGARAWRDTISRAAHFRARALGVSKREPESVIAALPASALSALVRKIFFSSGNRARVLFIAADNDIPISAFCERIGRALAQLSRATVGVIARDPESTGNQAACAFEPSSSVEAGGKLCRVPFEVLEGDIPKTSSVGPSVDGFDYLILGATIADDATPLLCKASDGAVLVITANQTRREAALRAKEILHGWNVELLGAVLDKRTFPVPEPIYRRL